MNIVVSTIVSLCIFGTASCSKLVPRTASRITAKLELTVLRENMNTFKKSSIFTEPLFRVADVTEKALVREQWSDLGDLTQKRLDFLSKLLKNSENVPDSEWLDRSVDAARSCGIDEESIQHDLVPFIQNIMDLDDLLSADKISKLQTELTTEYYSNSFFRLKNMWDLLDKQEKTEFRASLSPYLLDKVVREASLAYFINTVQSSPEIPSLNRYVDLKMFMESLDTTKKFLANFIDRHPTHAELEAPLKYEIEEVCLANVAARWSMIAAAEYLLNIMRIAEDIMGIDVNGIQIENKVKDRSGETHLE